MPDHNEPDNSATGAAALAGLAREVEGLRRAINDVEPLRKRVEDVAELVARLSESTAAGLAPRGDGPPAAVSWLDRRGRGDQAGALLTALVGWLDRILLQYTDAAKALPGCWLWHPDVIEELVWLMFAWRAAYEQDSYSSLAADWHDRLRPGVVRRITSLAGTCSLENHQTPTEPGRRVPLADAGPLIAGWWGSPEPTASPMPTDQHLQAMALRRKSTRDGRQGART